MSANVSGHETIKVLEMAFEWAFQHHSSIILVSTTGKTAKEMIRIIGRSGVRLVVMGHDSRRVSEDSSFDPEVIRSLKECGHNFIEDHSPMLPTIAVSRLIEKTLKIKFLTKYQREWIKKYGVGGKVCHILAQKAYRLGFLRFGEHCVCVGGSQSGVDTAIVLKIHDFEKYSKPEVVHVICTKN